MSDFISIQTLFCNKKLRFCSQRDYRWRKNAVDDLLSDINRALDTGSNHYLGTMILSKTEESVYEVIDGQQRLMTIILVLHLFLKEIRHVGYPLAIEVKVLENLITDFGRNTDFVSALLSNQQVEAFTRGEERIAETYCIINDKAKEVFTIGGDNLISKWLNSLLLFEVLPDFIDRYSTITPNLTEYKL